jgi:hypothetical protein
MKKLTCIVAIAIALVATACGASGDEEEGTGSDDSGTTTTTTEAVATETSGGSFGELEGICGDGDATVAAGEAGRGADKLYIGVATDRNSDIRPGLTREMWDASIGFVDWCNEQGGIQGLQIEPVELDAALLQVERAMTTACSDVFAMVGGGLVQDNLQFSGKESSDFHQCQMVDIPGYAVSPEKSDSNGQVQPLPNPGTSVSTTWIEDFAELYPEAATSAAIVYPDLPSLVIQKNKYEAAIDEVGIDNAGTFSYPVTGLPDWTPLAQTVIDSDATMLLFVGEPTNLSNLLAKLREQGWEGTPLLETNMYDPLLFSAGTTGPEGAVLRVTHHPFEEADDWPSIQKYQELIAEVPDKKQSSLGISALSAWLLFATAANACADENGGELTRTCILEQAAAVDEWTGGGLHIPVNPDPVETHEAAECSMLMIVENGSFQRLYPEVDGDGDAGDGFSCREAGVAAVPANEGKGVIDPSRPI